MIVGITLIVQSAIQGQPGDVRSIPAAKADVGAASPPVQEAVKGPEKAPEKTGEPKNPPEHGGKLVAGRDKGANRPDLGIKAATPPIKVNKFSYIDNLLSQSGFQIICQTPHAITVKKILYNGVFEAKRGYFHIDVLRPSESEFPVTLGIGDGVTVGWRFMEVNGSHEYAGSYHKDIIFLDIITDQGTFRFSPDGTFQESSP
jgi:hypothetical protein